MTSPASRSPSRRSNPRAACFASAHKPAPVTQNPYAAARFVRVAGATPRERKTSIRRCSPAGPFRCSIRRTIVRNGRCRRRPAPMHNGRPFMAIRSAPSSSAARADRLVIDHTFQTQSIDQVFLEPEAGLAWYDDGTRKLELVIGVQSPHEAADERRYAGVEDRSGASRRSDRRPLRLCRRRVRRQGPHDLSALHRAGRPVLAGPAGASRQRSLRSVSVRHQAPCRSRAQPHGGRPRDRADRGLRRPTRISTAAASPISPPRSPSSARPLRSASMTCRRST